MVEEYLACNECKTLEFKENTRALDAIVKTVVAFANTAGGTLIIGVRDKTREVIGVTNALKEEERIASAIADSIAPLLVPDLEIRSYRNKEIIILNVAHIAGPYYLKSEGPEKGIFVRFGSTNRKADVEMISALKLFASNRTYDELPLIHGKIDKNLIDTSFGWVKKRPSEKTCEMLGVFSTQGGKMRPTIGGVLLFGANRLQLLPDSTIRCARFKGKTKEKIVDQYEINSTLPFAILEVISFIERHTQKEAKIGRVFREDISEYPPFAIREAVINALLHADYSMTGCHIQIAIFDDRIEFTNPGGLPFGQTLQKALSGFSRLRNRVLGRVFRELKLIEQWGSGLQRIFAIYDRLGLKKPEIEEIGNQFRITLFSSYVERAKFNTWERSLIQKLKNTGSITPKEAAKLWKVTTRTSRQRLKNMLDEGILRRLATSEKDPRATFILCPRE